MKTFRTFLAILVFTASIPMIALADESCFSIPEIEIYNIAQSLSKEIKDFEELEPNSIAQKISEKAEVNCSFEDLLTIFTEYESTECLEIQDFNEAFDQLDYERQALIEKKDHAKLTSEYVTGMFNEINRIGQEKFFSEPNEYMGNSALYYTSTTREHVWEIEVETRGIVNEFISDLNNCTAQEYVDKGLDVEYGKFVKSLQDISQTINEVSNYVKEVAKLEDFIYNSFNEVSDQNSKIACELWDEYQIALNRYKDWQKESTRSKEESENYFNEFVVPFLDKYVGYAFYCKK